MINIQSNFLSYTKNNLITKLYLKSILTIKCKAQDFGQILVIAKNTFKAVCWQIEIKKTVR